MSDSRINKLIPEVHPVYKTVFDTRLKKNNGGNNSDSSKEEKEPEFEFPIDRVDISEAARAHLESLQQEEDIPKTR